jgi:phage repressor protein C with HTH and peptisase S24 domain
MNIDRISKFIDYEGVSNRQFEMKIGASNGVITRAVRNKTDIQSKWITLILENYPQINPSWLVTGKGEMLISEKNINELSSLSTNENKGFVIPLYNAEASAGIGQLQLSNEYIIDKLKVPFARNEDIALTIVGDSMTPAMQSGDIAVVRSMPNWKEYLDYGNIFIVVTENEVYCKIVQKNTEKDIFTLKSYNTNYNEFEIPKKFISQIYKVIGIISQRSY